MSFATIGSLPGTSLGISSGVIGGSKITRVRTAVAGPTSTGNITFTMRMRTCHASSNRHVLPTVVGSGCFALVTNRGGGMAVSFSRGLLRNNSCGLTMAPCGGWK